MDQRDQIDAGSIKKKIVIAAIIFNMNKKATI